MPERTSAVNVYWANEQLPLAPYTSDHSRRWDMLMHYERLEARFSKINNLNHAVAMLSWDDAAVMPPGGGVVRAEALATLNGVLHGELSAPEIADLIHATADEPLDAWQRANVLEMERSFDAAVAVPADATKEPCFDLGVLDLTLEQRQTRRQR